MFEEFTKKQRDKISLFEDFLSAEKLFNFHIPENIEVRDYIELRFLKLAMELILVQTAVVHEVGGIPFLDRNNELPFSENAEIIGRMSSYDLPVEIHKIVRKHLVSLCRLSIDEIDDCLFPLHGEMRKRIDPEFMLSSELEWDVYILYLNHFGFGLKSGFRARGSRHRVSIDTMQEYLMGKYSVEDLEDVFSVSGNLVSRRIILVNIAGLEGRWGDVGLLLSDYTRRTFGVPNADQFSRTSSEITPQHSFDDLLLDDEIVSDIKALCDEQLRNGENPLTLLFKGPSGVGKTTLAHAVSRYLGKQILRVSLRSSGTGALEVKMKYFCEVAKKQSFVLLFDEAESLFRSSLGREDTAGWARILFQEFKGIAIFTTNYSLPYGLDRRMTYSLELEDLSPKQKAKVIMANVQRCGFILNDKEVEYLAQIEISPGYYESIFRIAKARRNDGGSFAIIKKAFLQRASFLMSKSQLEKYESFNKTSKKLHFPEDLQKKLQPLRYGLLKYTQEPERFTKGLKAVFTGPPGVGKTAFALYLAEEAGLELKVITPSDILGMYVGENEKKIREIFRKPGESEKPRLIFLDEVEAILINRSFAQRTWELSMANELLTRLDSYPGVVIAATNRYDLLDPAFKRRFLYHIEFVLPSASERRRIWSDRCPQLSSEQLDVLSEYDLTGADIEDLGFKLTVLPHFSFEQILPQCKEIQESRRPSEKCISLV